MKDDEDMALEALFANEPIVDDGFSEQVLVRIRRRLWLRRLALPVATLAGLAIAFRPAVDAIRALRGIVPQLPVVQVEQAGLADMLAGLVPQASTFAVFAVIVVALAAALPAFED